MGGYLLAVRLSAQVEVHVVGSFSLREIQMDCDKDFILQPCRGKILYIHIDHGNQVFFGKPFDIPEGEQFTGLGTPLQIVQVVDDPEHVGIVDGDDPVMDEGFHLSLNSS